MILLMCYDHSKTDTGIYDDYTKINQFFGNMCHNTQKCPTRHREICKVTKKKTEQPNNIQYELENC